MKRNLLGALGALALWAGQASAQTTIIPIAYDDKAPAVVSGSSVDGCNHSYSCGRGGAYAGFGLYYIQPNFETNPAFRLNTGAVQRQQDFTYNMDIAPTFWLGWTNDDGVGGRVRYFEYAQGDTQRGAVPAGATIQAAQPLGLGIAPLAGGAGVIGIAESTLNVLTWDFELTKQWDCECWTIVGTAGLRYAHLAQNYRATGSAPQGAMIVFPGELASGHNFNGLGPTVSTEAKRHLGNGGASLYANGRLSLVYGTGQQSAYLSGAPDSLDLERHARQADLIPITELEIGLEANRDLGRASLLVQTGIVGQVYFGAGNAANSESIFTNGADSTSNLGFVGLVFRVGVGF